MARLSRAGLFMLSAFDPVGVAGRLYWYSVFPLHLFVFGGMLRGIARRAVPGGGGPPGAAR